MTTLFAREAAELVLSKLNDFGFLAKKYQATSVEEKAEILVAVAGVIDEKTVETRRELREFVAWWMRIIHHDHKGTYPEPDWRKCPSNVCKSTSDSFKDVKAPAEVPS